MLPLRSVGLWPDAQSDLAYLNAFVIERALADVSVPWAAIGRDTAH